MLIRRSCCHLLAKACLDKSGSGASVMPLKAPDGSVVNEVLKTLDDLLLGELAGLVFDYEAHGVEL